MESKERKLEEDVDSYAPILYNVSEKYPPNLLLFKEVFQRSHLRRSRKVKHVSHFVSIDKFDLSHLPASHQDDDLYRLLKVLADLTVKVDVKTTISSRSRVRPEEKTRSGSGRLWNMTKYTDGKNEMGRDHKYQYKTCTCLSCKHSESASSVWWEIYIETFRHDLPSYIVKYNRCCRFFYNTSESERFDIYRPRLESVSIENDTCMLVCVTCDVNLAIRLRHLFDQLDLLWPTVHKKFLESGDQLTFLVSHDMTGTKEVSVRQCQSTFKLNDDLFNNKLTYSPCSCPEGCGAFVYVIGFTWGLGGWHQ